MHRGDEAAARALWSAHAGKMEAYARAILPPSLKSASADTVQSVFCRILALESRRVREIKEGVSFLLSSVRNECITLIRSHRRRLQRERTAQRATSRSSDPRVLELHQALDLLPRREREIFVLKHIAGLTFDQIELATGTNRNTAASLYRQARQQLQRSLSDPPAQFAENIIEARL
jgi:RNA polymerase sigma factor (sigma-70 family)